MKSLTEFQLYCYGPTYMSFSLGLRTNSTNLYTHLLGEKTFDTQQALVSLADYATVVSCCSRARPFLKMAAWDTLHPCMVLRYICLIVNRFCENLCHILV
ncbi:hypothetical protein J1N35_002325 [Gossypium stocksii]|uniref:Uncharacterized protein n=1 Tax=Gossypium stocksii TaxID=47602 RepID=A0A9D3WJF5_9ROSI|nr:hypothetical protein J1N35_002325 [Gossypium stocksii]